MDEKFLCYSKAGVSVTFLLFLLLSSFLCQDRRVWKSRNLPPRACLGLCPQGSRPLAEGNCLIVGCWSCRHPSVTESDLFLFACVSEIQKSVESRWGGAGTCPTTIVASLKRLQEAQWGLGRSFSTFCCCVLLFCWVGSWHLHHWHYKEMCSRFAPRWVSKALGRRRASQVPSFLSGRWKLPDDLVWGQVESTGRWLASVGTGENRAVSRCSVGKALSQASKKEHLRFNHYRLLSRN